MAGRTLSDYPELLAEWHPTRNGAAGPGAVRASEKARRWWRCSHDGRHEWQAPTSVRTSRGSGCPYCAGKRATPENCLAARSPEIAAQWHPVKNGSLTPADVTRGSSKLAWWKCSKGPDHEWESKIYLRQRLGCPFCAGRRPSITNSLATLHPDLAKELHPTRNGDLTPADIASGTHKKFWWRCSEASDHEWEASVNNRVQNGTGCPFCASQKVSATNSLLALHPSVAEEWHPTLNGQLRPTDIAPKSTAQKIWWQCSKVDAHVWEATAASRIQMKTGCPFCAGQRVSHTNSIADLFPGVAAEWHLKKNGDKTPDKIVAGSRKLYWWRCAEADDHEWQATPSNRTKLASGCPFCTGRKASKHYSLAALFPEVAAQWHPTRNIPLSPSQVTPSSMRKVWWKCAVGLDHEWEMAVQTRTNGAGCPRCSGRWSGDALRAFVRGILPHLPTLTPAERYAIVRQNGLLDSGHRDFGVLLAAGGLSQPELEKFSRGQQAQADIAPDAFDTVGSATAQLEDLREVPETAVVRRDEASDHALPEVSADDVLGASLETYLASADEEAVEFFVASGVAKLWRHAYADEKAADAQTRAARSDPYAERIRERFRSEFEAARGLSIPPGYQFRADGKTVALPNLMQRHVAAQVRDRRRVGNWSGTGAGKTLSALLASRVIDSGLTVICCPNATVAGWEAAACNAFPDSQVVTKTLAPEWSARAAWHRYLIVNYETFQQPWSEARLKALVEESSIDMVVVDEIHFTKQRNEKQISQRRRLVAGLVAAAAEKNPDLAVLGMSATPVINNLQEGKSLVEMVTGLEHPDLVTRAIVANAMALHQRFVTLGSRWVPSYDVSCDELLVDVDCAEYIDELLALGARPHPLRVEQILTRARMKAILEAVRPKTLIYTHYVDGIVELLREALRETGWKVGVYTGVEKAGLSSFIDGDADVLIGSSAIGTGVDGLQAVSSRLIVNALPWTAAEYEQLKGRIYRQGQSEQVSVVLVRTGADVHGERWSWCQSRINRIRWKRSLADAAVDGIVPEGHLVSDVKATEALMAWLARLSDGELSTIERKPIRVPLTGTGQELSARLARYGDFAAMNQRWNATASAKTHQRLIDQPEEWAQYHTLYRQARESWRIVPFEAIADDLLQRRSGKIIGDFGCGERLLGKKLEGHHTVYSFDHVAIDNMVIACDMAHVPLPDGALDVAVFSLSLMGANSADYLREAHRCLEIGGQLLIAETRSRVGEESRFRAELEALGFDVASVDQGDRFVFVVAVRAPRSPR